MRRWSDEYSGLLFLLIQSVCGSSEALVADGVAYGRSRPSSCAWRILRMMTCVLKGPIWENASTFYEVCGAWGSRAHNVGPGRSQCQRHEWMDDESLRQRKPDLQSI